MAEVRDKNTSEQLSDGVHVVESGDSDAQVVMTESPDQAPSSSVKEGGEDDIPMFASTEDSGSRPLSVPPVPVPVPEIPQSASLDQATSKQPATDSGQDEHERGYSPGSTRDEVTAGIVSSSSDRVSSELGNGPSSDHESSSPKSPVHLGQEHWSGGTREHAHSTDQGSPYIGPASHLEPENDTGPNYSEQPDTGGQTARIDLGASIFQRNSPVTPVLSEEAIREMFLSQQKEMAKAYAASKKTAKNQQAHAADDNGNEDDSFMPQQQQVGQLDDSNDLELRYTQAKREFHRKRLNKTLKVEDELAFMKIERSFEQSRKKDQVIVESTDDEDEEEEVFVRPNKRFRNSKAKSGGRATPSDDSDPDGAYEEPPKKRGRGRPKKSDEAKKAPKKGKRKASKEAKAKKTKKTPGRLNREHGHLAPSNIFDDAQAAEGLEENQPTFDIKEVGKHRANALRMLVENVPEASRKTAITDRRILDQAIKDFTGRAVVRPAEGGKWLVSGMKTSLTPHQVIGTSFMRRREGNAVQPKGGILADQMGLGKTLMALANIVNGRPNPRIVSGRDIREDQAYTTLVVVTPALLTQWQEEIKRHVERTNRGRGWGFQSMMVYTERHCGQFDEADLLAHDIVLTTYNEVGRSWPAEDIPEGIPDSGPAKDEWLQEHFYGLRGLLHKTTFLRVCLDEAHMIRNADTRVSVACRALMAEHYWAITGTPMVNGAADLYALFEFIKHPDIKTQSGFKKRFVDTTNPMSLDKLGDEMTACMTRYTHRNQLFGARLVNLPKARAETVHLTFTRLEHAIYEIVRTRFATRIQQLSDDGQLRSKMTHLFVLMLRLRQLTSHPLMIQGEICSCLEREDFEKLERLVEREDSHRGDGAKLIIAMRNVLAKERAIAEARTAEEYQDGADEQYHVKMPPNFTGDNEAGELTGIGQSHGKNMRFSKYLTTIKESVTYQKMNERTKCVICHQPPHEPHITDCFHIYCKDCLNDLLAEAAGDNLDKASCASCGKEMTARPLDTSTTNDNNRENSGEPGGVKKDDDWLNMNGEVLPSTKTIATKSQILNWWDPQAGGDEEVKIIIFTQWLGMVKVLTKMCETEKWGCCTLTGNLSHKKRDSELNRFRTDPETRILISSLKCGGLGLNLTVASKVIIIDPWWNEAIEQQAFCRVFRIGQDRETSMVNLAIEGSIDDRLFELKALKKLEIDKVMKDHKKRHNVDLRTVLGVFGEVAEDENGRLYFTELEGNGNGGNGTSDAGDDEDMEQ